MPPTVVDIAGWFPAIIFPTATLIQLAIILGSGSTKGTSRVTWALFGLANIGTYIFTEKYFEIQPIVGYLLTAALDFAIVAMVISGYGRNKAQATA